MLKATDRKIIYICADSSTAAKMGFVKLLTETALRMGMTPIAPPACFAEYLDSDNPADNTTATEVGLSLLRRCDEVWIFGNDTTRQMATEISLAQNLDIPIKKAALFTGLSGIRTRRLPTAFFEVRVAEV